MNNRTTARLHRSFRQLRTLGPYFAMALVVPGGSLFALLAWLYNHGTHGKKLE